MEARDSTISQRLEAATWHICDHVIALGSICDHTCVSDYISLYIYTDIYIYIQYLLGAFGFGKEVADKGRLWRKRFRATRLHASLWVHGLVQEGDPKTIKR